MGEEVPARAAGLHVDDGHARHAEGAEHFVTCCNTGVRRAAEGGLETAAPDTGLGKCGAHRDDTHVGRGQAVEPAERVHADAGDLHSRHAASNA